MSQVNLPSELLSEFEAVALDSGCELEHIEFKGDTLRLTLDRPEGVTLDHCQTVSRQISSLLDVSDFGNRRYLLEVSSPGLDRELRKPEDFERFRGSLIRVTWKEPEMANKKTIVARLENYRSDPDTSIEIVEAATQQRYTIYFKNIELVRLEPEL
jgi:ribosome maturation factor RimP